MPLSFETLVRYRAAHADGPESGRAWFFHSHVYFDQAVPERVAQAQAFGDRIRRTFAATDHLEVHPLVPFPAGPHPRGSFEVLFTRAVFAEYVTWLMFARDESLDILVHPLTGSQTLDHTQRALWLGAPIAIERAVLEAADASALATGRAEESIIDGTKRHLPGSRAESGPGRSAQASLPEFRFGCCPGRAVPACPCRTDPAPRETSRRPG